MRERERMEVFIERERELGVGSFKEGNYLSLGGMHMFLLEGVRRPLRSSVLLSILPTHTHSKLG